MTEAIKLFYERYKNKPQIDHIIDYLKETHSHKKSINFNYDQALIKANEWVLEINKKNESVNKGVVEDFMKFDNGFRIVRLIDKDSKKWEGVMMGHCVGSDSYSRNEGIFSLRDNSGNPHATIEINGKEIVQIQGKANTKLKDRYVSMVLSFISKFDYYFEDVEKDMAKLGFTPIPHSLNHIFIQLGFDTLHIDQTFVRFSDRKNIDNRKISSIYHKYKSKLKKEDLLLLAAVLDHVSLFKKAIKKTHAKNKILVMIRFFTEVMNKNIDNFRIASFVASKIDIIEKYAFLYKYLNDFEMICDNYAYDPDFLKDFIEANKDVVAKHYDKIYGFNFFTFLDIYWVHLDNKARKKSMKELIKKINSYPPHLIPFEGFLKISNDCKELLSKNKRIFLLKNYLKHSGHFYESLVKNGRVKSIEKFEQLLNEADPALFSKMREDSKNGKIPNYTSYLFFEINIKGKNE